MVFFFTAVTVLLRLFGAWFLVTALAGIFRRSARYPERAPETRFACLIPARNEEAVISRSVGSLLSQNYPRELFDVFVLPNNCTDGTAEEAMRAGAKIIRTKAPVRCKGDVLRQALCDGRTADYDAIVVFDADNLVLPDYLSRMNDAFLAGAGVAKGRLRVLNAFDTATSGCYALYFGIFDWFFNRSRASLAMSAKLVGTGFAVSRRVLDRMGGWNTETIAEDAEFSAVCAEMGEKVWWVPDAVSLDEAPQSFAVSLRQRRRWCSGIMDVSRIKAGPLFAAAGRALTGREGRGRAVRALDGALFLCSPFVQAVSPFTGAAALAAGTVRTIQIGAPEVAAVLALSAAAGWLAMTVFGSLLAFLSGYRTIRIAKSVVLFPLFMASWVPLAVISLFHRTKNWEEIRHGLCTARRTI